MDAPRTHTETAPEVIRPNRRVVLVPFGPTMPGVFVPIRRYGNTCLAVRQDGKIVHGMYEILTYQPRANEDDGDCCMAVMSNVDQRQRTPTISLQELRALNPEVLIDTVPTGSMKPRKVTLISGIEGLSVPLQADQDAPLCVLRSEEYALQHGTPFQSGARLAAYKRQTGKAFVELPGGAGHKWMPLATLAYLNPQVTFFLEDEPLDPPAIETPSVEHRDAPAARPQTPGTAQSGLIGSTLRSIGKLFRREQ